MFCTKLTLRVFDIRLLNGQAVRHKFVNLRVNKSICILLRVPNEFAFVNLRCSAKKNEFQGQINKEQTACQMAKRKVVLKTPAGVFIL